MAGQRRFAWSSPSPFELWTPVKLLKPGCRMIHLQKNELCPRCHSHARIKQLAADIIHGWMIYRLAIYHLNGSWWKAGAFRSASMAEPVLRLACQAIVPTLREVGTTVEALWPACAKPLRRRQAKVGVIKLFLLTGFSELALIHLEPIWMWRGRNRETDSRHQASICRCLREMPKVATYPWPLGNVEYSGLPQLFQWNEDQLSMLLQVRTERAKQHWPWSSCREYPRWISSMPILSRLAYRLWIRNRWPLKRDEFSWLVFANWLANGWTSHSRQPYPAGVAWICCPIWEAPVIECRVDMITSIF